MRRSSLVAFCLCLVVCAQACKQQRDSAPEIVLKHQVLPQPAHAGQVTFILSLAETSGRPVHGAQVKLEGNMSHAGMAPVFADAKEIEPGRYLAPMDLSMAGDWIIMVHGTLPDGRKLERQIETQIAAD